MNTHRQNFLTRRDAGIRGELRGCNQKFPDWPPGARTENIIALCH